MPFLTEELLLYYNMKDVPTTEDAVDMYQQQSGVLTDPSEFGTDPTCKRLIKENKSFGAILCQLKT